MKGQTDGGKGGGANPSCHLPNPSITFLISLSLSPPVWLSDLLFHLIVYRCHSKLNFCLSLHCLTPLFPSIPSPSHLFSFSFPFSPLTICLSPQKKHTRYYTPTTQQWIFPSCFRRESGKKNKKYKIAIFRFMSHGQKKYNHDCVGRLGEAAGREEIVRGKQDRGEK